MGCRCGVVVVMAVLVMAVMAVMSAEMVVKEGTRAVKRDGRRREAARERSEECGAGRASSWMAGCRTCLACEASRAKAGKSTLG